MSEDRFKEAFGRIVSETPDAPRFSDLESRDVASTKPSWLTPWVAAAGAAVIVLIVVGVVGALGGGGPDLAQPDDGQIRYLRIEYEATVDPVCRNGEIVDNGNFEEATIELWGPNSSELTLMVVTFPDGSTERSIVEGNPIDPDRAWGMDPETFYESTGFRNIACRTGAVTSSFADTFLLRPPYEAGFVPSFWLGPPSGFASWEDALGPNYEVTKTEWAGYSVTKLSRTDTLTDGHYDFDFYVAPENASQLIGFRHVTESDMLGQATIEATVVETALVAESEVDFSTEGLFFIAKPGAIVIDERDRCPVTTPGQGFTPPDGYPATPTEPGHLWFGKDDLWTLLPTDGNYQPRKSVWWSVNFPGGGEEPNPPILVTHSLLNAGRDVTLFSDAPTNAYSDRDGWFMLATIDPNSGGCWQVTAIYKGASLTYVYYSEGPVDPEEFGVVPSVVGITLERAIVELSASGYQAVPLDSDDPYTEVCAQEPGAGVELDPGSVVSLRTAAAIWCDALLDPSISPNTRFDTYTDDLGRTWYATSCPDADVLLRAGVDHADALPKEGATDYVSAADSQETFAVTGADSWGVTSSAVGIRHGDVWYTDEDGEVRVRWFRDYLIEAYIDDPANCPSVPYTWNGVPVAFTLEDTE